MWALLSKPWVVRRLRAVGSSGRTSSLPFGRPLVLAFRSGQAVPGQAGGLLVRLQLAGLRAGGAGVQSVK